MGFFNVIETFFFVSLAISFILILLLVYHFKQRMTVLEQKSDTMVGIINDIAKELTYVKQVSTNYMMTSVGAGAGAHSVMYSFPPPFHGRSAGPAYGVSGIEPIEEDDEDEDDDDDEDDEDDDDDEGAEDDHEDASMEPHLHTARIVVSDTEDEEEKIKIINMLTEEVEDDDEPTPEPTTEEAITSTPEDITVEVSVPESVQDTEPLVLQETEPVSDLTPEEKDTYRKMTTQALKTVVTTKGLMADPSKLKKYELLQLLGAATQSLAL